MSREDIEARLRELHSALFYSDECGDWKIARYNEEVAMGIEPHYNIEELHIKRQAIRDEINELELMLEEVDETLPKEVNDTFEETTEGEE